MKKSGNKCQKKRSSIQGLFMKERTRKRKLIRKSTSGAQHSGKVLEGVWLKLILPTMVVDLLFLRQHFQLIGMCWSLSRDLVLKNLMNYFLEFIGTLEGDIQAENE